jgi:hypothetical protein
MLPHICLLETIPTFGDVYFHVCHWSEYYPNAPEPILPNIPEALSHAFSTTCYVDADHAGCRVTRCSQTGIIIYVQKAPVVWYSKQQNTVESATLGTEFIALKTAIDQVDPLRYKLRMFGIPLNGPTSVNCDNEAVVKILYTLNQLSNANIRRLLILGVGKRRGPSMCRLDLRRVRIIQLIFLQNCCQGHGCRLY